MATENSKNRTKYKFNERSTSLIRDPAFTNDVRHLALPLRRNSGPESKALKMFGKKKVKANSKDNGSSHYSLRMERRKASPQANNYSAEYLCKNSSSSESLDTSLNLPGHKGLSLDRNSFDIEIRPQGKPKRLSWFLRDRNRDKKSRNDKFLKRASLDSTVACDTKQIDKPRKTIQRQNAADYTVDLSTLSQEDNITEPKKSGLKRFLKGEIGIRSFNYYLLKEGLKKNAVKEKQEAITDKPAYKSKSEENIYEEIYFRHDLPTPKPRTPPALPPFNKQTSISLPFKNPLKNDGNCTNCEICLKEAQEKNFVCSLENHDKCERLISSSLSGSKGYTQVIKKCREQSVYDFSQTQNQTILQFQSYNPNNPSVYKIESTPVAFEYSALEEQILQKDFNQQEHVQSQQKTSSSSDSIKGNSQYKRHQVLQQPSNEFYTRPNFLYQSSEKSLRKEQGKSLCRTDSSNSMHSENSLNKIYNSKTSSQKSIKSVDGSHNRDETQLRQDMSDSSLGDSLFSSDANKRYFGSSESCRFNYECRRRGSVEKCSFSDTCRYDCNLRNCDCSSSYFSSDFDDTNIKSTTSNNSCLVKSHHQQSSEYKTKTHDEKGNKYADDFIKHISNVKRRSQNIPFDDSNMLMNTQQMTSIYEVPKINTRHLDFGASRTEYEKTYKINDELINELTISGLDKMLTNFEFGKTIPPKNNTAIFIGSDPNLSSSISSNESKKKTCESHGDKSVRNKSKHNVIKESLHKKIIFEGEKALFSSDSFSNKNLTSTKTPGLDKAEKPKSNDSNCNISIAKGFDNFDGEDKNDEVFLDGHGSMEIGSNIEKPCQKTKLNNKKNSDQSDCVSSSPTKICLKASNDEIIKTYSDKPVNTKQGERVETSEVENNNKDLSNIVDVLNESDDDDSVFINENKPKKKIKSLTKNKIKTNLSVTPASSNVLPSVLLSDINVSSLKNKLLDSDTPHISHDLNLKSGTVERDFKEKQLTENGTRNPDINRTEEFSKHSNDSSEQIDFINIPLPDIPLKKQLNKENVVFKDNLATGIDIQSKWKKLTDKEHFKKMNHRNTVSEEKPTYLFGEESNNKSKDGIFLNRSGWLQTNKRDKSYEAQKENDNKLKTYNSKIEELISRNETRNHQILNSKDENITILRIDPGKESHPSLNDRPGFLPVRSSLMKDRPPPTPILSPPVAFQDHRMRNRIIDMKKGARIQLSVTDTENKTSTGKGMVSSRSFEYDRKNTEPNDNFSRSFDFDFSLNEKIPANKNLLSRYGNLTNFSSLTGASPSYLTKKEKVFGNSPLNSMSSIFPKVIPGNQVTMKNLNYYNPNCNSTDDGVMRRSQFTKLGMPSKYRSLEAKLPPSNNRLNSCDSGARSDFSNDDLDEDHNDTEKLFYKSATVHKEPLKNTRNAMKTLLNQHQTKLKKIRSITSETSIDDNDLQSLNRCNSKKQRSLTPEKRPITPEIFKKSSKFTNSQTSLMSRQSSSSRNNTLERQLKQYEEGKLSSSSSSCSEVDNRLQLFPIKTNFGDFKIRRSRSLQLSERSPARSQLKKVIVRISNTPEKQSTNMAKLRERKPDRAHIRSKTTLNIPSKYISQSLRNSDNSIYGSSQTRSFEMLDFNEKSNMDFDFEFDSKSKSFDDDFCFNTKVTRHKKNRQNAFSGNRASSQDRVVAPSMISHSLRNSPRNYGSRLYDHDIVYDDANRRAATRSPIMNFNNRASVNPISRERSPLGGRRVRDKERDTYKKQTNILNSRTTTTRNRSPNCSPSDSDDSINNNVLKNLKDKSLVAEYLFGLKRKQQSNLIRSGNMSGAPTSSGSCTSSGCEYSPQRGLNRFKKSSLDNKSSVNLSYKKFYVQNDSENDLPVRVCQSQQNQKGSYSLTLKVDNSQRRLFNHIIEPTVIFLGDCEMPITNSVTNKKNCSGFKITKQLSEKENRRAGKPNEEEGICYLSDQPIKIIPPDFNELRINFSPNSIRAVSSPSLTDTSIDISTNSSPLYLSKLEPKKVIADNSELGNNGNVSALSSGNVLQKLRKTIFKTGKVAPDCFESNEIKQHKFGLLVWRSSKERRKNKSYRQDKCNSGDSGIQVELNSNENLLKNVPLQDMTMQLDAKVRRVNSAGAAENTSKKHKCDPRRSSRPSNITKYWLSQPSDLDSIVYETEIIDDLKNIKETPDDESETDNSISSTEKSSFVYAEVLYTFNSVGPQELSLQKGCLVEVLKRETGPWWWGRIKHDAVADDEETHQGWFPKEFVKVLPIFGKTRKIISHRSAEFDCDIHQDALLPPISTAPSVIPSLSNSESFKLMRDNVIKELLETEISYVKLLNALVDGYINDMKKHPEIFSLESISLIFSNIEEIHDFQQTFLEALRLAVPNGRIAWVFLEFKTTFMVYSKYCNSYPKALMELERISANTKACEILENCRIARNLPELPLSAHLLAPIQRICRYPLHLSELVKYSVTRKEILLKMNVQKLSKSDLEFRDSNELFEVALNAMKRVTEMVNESKRQSEYLSRMQCRFENFQGPSINVHSTRLFLQTDAIRVTQNLWNSTCTLFLFDRQLIYCRRDLLKRTSYIYKGRIFLDNCRILNLPDGKLFGVILKNALKIFCDFRGKWFDFCFRSNSSKLRFLNTLSAERQFCGSSLFISELATAGLDDDNFTDDFSLRQGYVERGIDVEQELHTFSENVTSNKLIESPTSKQHMLSNTLPKKLRNHSKENLSEKMIDYNILSASTNKRRLGNWFRKSKGTNSTPSDSPTNYHPLVTSSNISSIVDHSDSKFSSKSSHLNCPRQEFNEIDIVGLS